MYARSQRRGWKATTSASLLTFFSFLPFCFFFFFLRPTGAHVSRPLAGLILGRGLRDTAGTRDVFHRRTSRYTERFSPPGHGARKPPGSLGYSINVYDLINALSPRCLAARLARPAVRARTTAPPPSVPRNGRYAVLNHRINARRGRAVYALPRGEEVEGRRDAFLKFPPGVNANLSSDNLSICSP